MKIVLLLIFLFLTCFGRLSAEEVLTWGDCIREAAKNNPDLIASQAEVKQSEASKQQTANGLFPQITADLSGATAKTAGPPEQVLRIAIVTE